MERREVDQSTQAEIGELLVGVMKAGAYDGVSRARLLVRAGQDSEVVDLTPGESAEVVGRGRLSLVGVVPASREHRATVTLEWEPKAERS